MQIILFIIGMALSADGLYFGATTGMGVGEALVVGMGVIFILWSVLYDTVKNNGFLKFLKRVFVFCMTVFVVYSCAVCIIGGMDNANYNEDYLIVLGAGLNGSTPSRALEERLITAAEYMNRNGSAVAIVSGGQGEGETITEAQAMADYLMYVGIPAERILLEEKAESTYENFHYSAAVVGRANAAFVTSDFHVVRSEQMAKLNGIAATHIGASTPVTLLPVSCARELAAQIASIRYYI